MPESLAGQWSRAEFFQISQTFIQQGIAGIFDLLNVALQMDSPGCFPDLDQNLNLNLPGRETQILHDQGIANYV